MLSRKKKAFYFQLVGLENIQDFILQDSEMKYSMNIKFMKHNLETREMLDIWEVCVPSPLQRALELSREMTCRLGGGVEKRPDEMCPLAID